MVILDSLTGAEALENLGLSEGAKALMPSLVELPLASASDVAGLLNGDVSGAYARLWELHGARLVECHPLGATKSKVNRWWVTEHGLDAVGFGGLAWQQPWTLSQVLDRLPAAEWFYHVAFNMKGLGELRNFQWFTGISWDAAARYDRGWVAFFWSGILQVEARLRAVLGQLAGDLRSHSVDGGAAWPALLVFVASDQWQQELVIQVTRLFGLEEMVQVWCVADGSVRGAQSGVGRGGWVFQEFEMRDMGGWSWPDRLADCLWSQGYGGGSNRLLSLVGEWPEMRSVFAGRALGGDGNSKHFLKVLRQLVDLRLVSRTGGRKARYRLTSRGYWVMASRDRVPNNVMLAGVKGPVGASARRLALHEDGVMQMVGSFSQGGLATGAGWRWWEGLEGGAIVPDAMVYVGDGPFGPGWHFVEYERYVRGTFRAERKLRGYLAGDRRERWPLLIVVWNEEVEAVFHELGRAAGLLMLTATMDRLRRFGPAGNSECWSMYGQRVYVGSWGGGASGV